MPGAYPTWAKWVGQAHLACSLPLSAFIRKQDAQLQLYCWEPFQPMKKSFLGGPAGKCWLILDSIELFDAGPGVLSGEQETLLLMVFIGVGLNFISSWTFDLVYRWSLPGVGVWGLRSSLSTWLQLSSSRPWMSLCSFSQRPSEYRKVIEMPLFLWPISFFKSAGLRLMCHGPRAWHQNSSKGKCFNINQLLFIPNHFCTAHRDSFFPHVFTSWLSQLWLLSSSGLSAFGDQIISMEWAFKALAKTVSPVKQNPP